MGTLSSELGSHVEELSRRPRIYVDANVPAGAIAHMRERLRWDVLAVVEDDELRRARDLDHYRTARRLHRTLITLDDDFLDTRTFVPEESPGVIVLSAPGEAGLVKLLHKINRAFFLPTGRRPQPTRPAKDQTPPPALPLEGRTIQVHPDWEPPVSPVKRKRRRRRRTRRAVVS